jgi:hypothetical protein
VASTQPRLGVGLSIPRNLGIYRYMRSWRILHDTNVLLARRLRIIFTPKIKHIIFDQESCVHVLPIFHTGSTTLLFKTPSPAKHLGHLFITILIRLPATLVALDRLAALTLFIAHHPHCCHHCPFHPQPWPLCCPPALLLLPSPCHCHCCPIILLAVACQPPLLPLPSLLPPLPLPSLLPVPLVTVAIARVVYVTVTIALVAIACPSPSLPLLLPPKPMPSLFHSTLAANAIALLVACHPYCRHYCLSAFALFVTCSHHQLIVVFHLSRGRKGSWAIICPSYLGDSRLVQCCQGTLLQRLHLLCHQHRPANGCPGRWRRWNCLCHHRGRSNDCSGHSNICHKCGMDCLVLRMGRCSAHNSVPAPLVGGVHAPNLQLEVEKEEEEAMMGGLCMLAVCVLSALVFC